MTPKKSDVIFDLLKDENGVYSLPRFSMPPGPYYSLIDRKNHYPAIDAEPICIPPALPAAAKTPLRLENTTSLRENSTRNASRSPIEGRTRGLLSLPVPKALPEEMPLCDLLRPFGSKNCMPKYEYIEFNKTQKERKLHTQKEFDLKTLFIECIKKELHQKKKNIKTIDLRKHYPWTESSSTSISGALKLALAIKLKEAGFDPIAIETGIRKKHSRRGGRKHGRSGWFFDREANAWVRTKTRPGTNLIKIDKVYPRSLKKDPYESYGSTVEGLVHVG